MKFIPLLPAAGRLLVLLGVLAALRIASAEDLPDLGESARVELSSQLERRIGQSIMNEIRQREPSYIDDSEIGDYLNRLGARLVAASANPTGEFHFFAIRDSTVNAFAMFGGYIGVNTGTMLVSQSESELAGVMAHEIAHVTQSHLARQIAQQKQNTIPSLIALAVGILAARSNADIGGATIVGSQAAMVQSQLAYTRDFEREADRVGYQMLSKAGFEVRGMSDFFERLQKAGRVYENNAPIYLRSHPLSGDRMSDMQNREQSAPYRQVISSLDFYLVRAKITATGGLPKEVIAELEERLREKKYTSLAALRYGLALAHLRAGDVPAAQREMDAVRALKVSSAMITGLAGQIRLAAGDPAAAQALYREGLQRFPQSKSLVYGYADALYAGRQHEQALVFLESQVQSYVSDFRLYELQAKNHAALGRRLQQHRALAELYFHQGRLGAAVEQLQFAQKEADGNFYEQSAVDARLRELRKAQAEEAKQRRF